LTGIPSGVVSVPARYIHSPLSMINKKDYENTIKLFLEFLI
ncbi:MAG: M42 family peptidase, partial [Fervidobacterium sp.]